MPFVPDKSGQPTAPARADHFVPDVAPSQAPAQSGFWGDFAHELWQQGGQDLLQNLQEHPIGTIAHLLGSAAGISTGTTPVPGPNAQIEVPPAMRESGPAQIANVADVAQRGPAAIAAATTLSALPIALGLGGKALGTSRLATASGASLRAGIGAVPNALETSALRFTGLPQIVRPMINAFKESMTASKAPTNTIPWSQIIARAAEKEPAPLPASVTQELTRPSETAPVAPTVPQAAPPAPAAPVPPETPLQANVVPPSAKAEPSAAEVAQTKARGMRAANAETLSQAFQDAGVTSDSLRNLRVWNWPDAAKQVGVDFPTTHSARLKLIRDTLARLQQREAK